MSRIDDAVPSQFDDADEEDVQSTAVVSSSQTNTCSTVPESVKTEVVESTEKEVKKDEYDEQNDYYYYGDDRDYDYDDDDVDDDGFFFDGAALSDAKGWW